MEIGYKYIDLTKILNNYLIKDISKITNEYIDESKIIFKNRKNKVIEELKEKIKIHNCIYFRGGHAIPFKHNEFYRHILTQQGRLISEIIYIDNEYRKISYLM